jgi:hypothetical protein
MDVVDNVQADFPGDPHAVGPGEVGRPVQDGAAGLPQAVTAAGQHAAVAVPQAAGPCGDGAGAACPADSGRPGEEEEDLPPNWKEVRRIVTGRRRHSGVNQPHPL